MKKLLLACVLAFGVSTSAQVGPPQATNPNTNNGYGFTQTSGTYMPLSSNRTVWQAGATLGTDAVSAAINLPSVFKFNGRSYNSVYLSNNGFVTFGSPPLAATYTGLSTDTTAPYEGAFAGFAANLKNANTTTSEIAYETIGSKFIVQFTDLQGSSASAAQLLNFQIQFDMVSNSVSIVYGNCVSGSATLDGQVGIRGAESSDTNNRTGIDWTATAIGTGSSSAVTLGITNAATVPASGLTFNYFPGTWITPPTSYASLPFTETFSSWVNGNSTGDLPGAAYWRTWPSRGDNSWRASDINAGGFSSSSGWTGVLGTATVAAPGIAPTARFHSYNTINASGYMDLYINLSTGTGTRQLSYDYQNTSGTDVLKIMVSTDGGITFNQVGTTQGISASWTTKYVDLNASSPTAIVRFMATGDNGSNDIYVDNVNITNVSCMLPDTVTAGTTTATTVPVSWTMTNPAPAFDIYYSTTNTAPTGTTIPNVIGTTGLSYTLTNLTPNTTYYLWVRSRCSSSDQSLWVPGSSFVTKTFCPTVSAPASSATGVSLTPTFTWAANSDATGYRVTVGTTSGGTDVLNSFDVGNVLTYTLPNALAYNTKYYYTVNSYNATQASTGCSERTFTTLSICPVLSAPAASAVEVSLNPTFTWTASASTAVTGYKLRIGTTPGGNDVLNNIDVGNVTTYTLPVALTNSTLYYWSVGAYTATQNSLNCTERSFTTVCSAISAFSENFDGVATSSWPPCWGKVGTAGTVSITASTAISGPNALSMLSSSATSLAVVKMRPVSTLSTGNYRLRFKARSSSTVGGKIEVGYLTDPATASTFVSLATYTTTSITVPDTFILSNINVPAGNQVLAFRHTGSPSNAVLIDDVNYEVIPTCLEASGLTASSPTPSGASLAWTAPSSAPANGYEIYYSTSSTDPAANVVLNSTNSTTSAATSKVLAGLLPSTTYYVWVRSVCIGTDRSLWSASASFATLCQPPAILSTTGATVCPGSTATLNATASSGAAINWYDSATGGNLLATGGSYTTPALTATTTYYVGARTDADSSVGPVSPAAHGGTIGAQTIAWGVYYTTTATATLKSVDIFPVTSGQTGSIKIVSGSQSGGAGTAIATIPFTTNVSGGSTAQTIAIDVELPAGSYTLYPTLPSSGLSRNISGATYPYISSVANITGNGFDPAYYMCFYNFKFNTGCQSARQAVVATADGSACLGTSDVTKSSENIKVYPNPFSDILNISDITNVKNVLVTDVAGRLVKTIANPSSVLHLGELKQGMYLITLEMKDGSKQTIKTIKK